LHQCAALAAGTVAGRSLPPAALTGTLPEPARSFGAGGQSMPLARKPTKEVVMRARKPNGRSGGGHGNH